MNTCNIKNRTIFCRDNLEVMRGINSDSIDLIYLDPPFNKKKVFTAPIGSSAEGASFKDIFHKEDVKDEWLGIISEKNSALEEYLRGITNTGYKYNRYYLIYMAIRLLEMHRVLKDTGSIYLHCDLTMSHYLKLLMDCIFGEKNFKNEIIWQRVNAHSDGNRYGINLDNILFYNKTKQYTWNKTYTPYTKEYIEKNYNNKDSDGRVWMSDNLTAKGLQGGGYTYEYKGVTSLWRMPLSTMKELDRKGELHFTTQGIRKKRYLDTMEGRVLQSLFSDIVGMNKKEYTGYPTQKPLSLLERIIKASSNEGDTVLDPFCGCATTCIAAEKLGRQWIGIDVSQKAYQLVQARVEKEVWGNPDSLYKNEGAIPKIISRDDIPSRTVQDPDHLEVSTDNASMRDKKRTLYGYQAGVCKGCDMHFQIQNLTVDHIVPRESGGGDEIENLMLLCGHCNSVKGHRGDLAYLKSMLRGKNIIK